MLIQIFTYKRLKNNTHTHIHAYNVFMWITFPNKIETNIDFKI